MHRRHHALEITESALDPSLSITARQKRCDVSVHAYAFPLRHFSKRPMQTSGNANDKLAAVVIRARGERDIGASLEFGLDPDRARVFRHRGDLLGCLDLRHTAGKIRKKNDETSLRIRHDGIGIGLVQIPIQGTIVGLHQSLIHHPGQVAHTTGRGKRA
jgi:hypothetical protein